MRKLWANAIAVVMTLSVFAGCNKGIGEGESTDLPTVTEHTCSFTRKVLSAEYLRKNPTCSTQATYYYSCSCGAKGKDFFAIGDAKGHPTVGYGVCGDCGEEYGTPPSDPEPDTPVCGQHVYEEQVATSAYKATDATCYAQATYYYSCVCGEKDLTRTFSYGAMEEHDFTGAWVTDEDEHWHVCENDGCDATDTKEAHYGGTATETAKAVCDGCGEAYGDYYVPDEPSNPGEEEHQHVFEQKKATQEFLAHESENCSEKTTYYYSCECGEKDLTRTFEGTETGGHVFTRKRRLSSYLAAEASCEHAKTYFYCCQYCDEMSEDTYEYGNKADHDYSSQEATVVYLKTTATCEKPACYYLSCKWCGEASTTNYFEFGAPSGRHTGGTATENERAICDVCGTAYGETLSHVHSFVKQIVSGEHLKKAPTCSTAAEYWLTCGCGVDSEFIDNTKFFVAGDPTGRHTGGTATTTQQALCENCGTPYGDLLLSQVVVDSVSSGYTRYDVGTANARKTEGFGTQFDTCIVEKQNGLNEEEWQLQVNALKKMNLQNVRVRFYPEMYERGNDNNDPYSFDYSSANVDFDSIEMNHLYKLLDVFEENGVKVDLSWYGCRTTFNSEDGKVDGSWLGGTLRENNSNWMVAPNKGSNPNEEFAESVAACLNYLINVKGYTCVNEYSIFPEPDGLYKLTTANYVAISDSIENRLTSMGIADKMLFSGPASMDIAAEKYNNSAATWGNTAAEFDSKYLQQFVSGGESVFEKVTVSAYPFTNQTSNAQMLQTAQKYVAVCNKYNLSWGIAECGTSTATSNVSNEDADKYDRAMFMARFFINLVNAGCTNIKYFVFSDCGYDSTLNQLGLFYFRNKNFAPKPVWYTWSLICRYTDIGSEVYPITSVDSDVCITALKLPDGSWTYVAANTAAEAKKVAIVNGRADRARSMNLYEVRPSTVGGSELKVVSAKSTVSTQSGKAEFSIPANSVVVLSNKA